MPRPAKTLAAHALAGTTSEAKSISDSQIPQGRPKFPAGATKEVRAEFKRLCQQLEKRRALTEGDGRLLEVCAEATVCYRRACATLHVEGEIRNYEVMDSNGQPHQVLKENKWLKIRAQAEKTLIACLDRLGLTSLNRDKVKPAKPVADKLTVIPGSMADQFPEWFDEKGEFRADGNGNSPSLRN